MIINNGEFAEFEVLENFQGLCGPRTRTCKLVLEDPRGQGLSSRTTTLYTPCLYAVRTDNTYCKCANVCVQLIPRKLPWLKLKNTTASNTVV